MGERMLCVGAQRASVSRKCGSRLAEGEIGVAQTSERLGIGGVDCTRRLKMEDGKLGLVARLQDAAEAEMRLRSPGILHEHRSEARLRLPVVFARKKRQALHHEAVDVPVLVVGTRPGVLDLVEQRFAVVIPGGCGRVGWNHDGDLRSETRP